MGARSPVDWILNVLLTVLEQVFFQPKSRECLSLEVVVFVLSVYVPFLMK